MRIGQFRSRVMVQKPIEVRSNSGAISTSWQTVATVWGQVGSTQATLSVQQRENLISNQVLSERDVLIRLRWAPVIADIGPTWRLRCKNKIFNITGVTDVEERNKELHVQCKSGLNDG